MNTAQIDATHGVSPAAGDIRSYRGAQTSSLRFSAGVDGIISTNVEDGGGNLSYMDFCDKIRDMVRVNARRVRALRWVAFHGIDVAGQLAAWGLDKVREKSALRAMFGLSVTEIIVAGLPGQGSIPFVQCPIFDDTEMQNGFYLLNVGGDDDGPDLGLRYLQEGPPYNTNWNIRAMGEDGKDISPTGGSQMVKAWEYIIGLEMHHEKSHMKMTNVC
jgi:hypothetical protein